MSKRSRGHRPPSQSRIIPAQAATAGGVSLDQLQNMKAQQESQIRARVEGLAAAIYAQNVSLYSYNMTSDYDDSPYKGLFNALDARDVAARAVDAALVFAHEVWGIQGQRVNPIAQQSLRPPQPIVEG